MTDRSDKSDLDADLRSLGYDPVTIAKKGDALARILFQMGELKSERDALRKEAELWRKEFNDVCDKGHKLEKENAELRRVNEGLEEALKEIVERNGPGGLWTGIAWKALAESEKMKGK